MKKSDYYIEYTSTNGAIVMPNGSFDATIVGNFYENGIGKLYFDAPVISIVGYAFDGYTSLASVTIPDSVTKIGGKAFNGCTSLKEIYCKSTTPPTGSTSMFNNNALDRKIYVPSNSVDAYKSAQYWSNYASYIVGYDF
jgi:hypothetical protein